MNYKCLEITQLSESGKKVKRIRCFAGRVTVFRAKSQTALDPFVRAIAGRNSAARFTLLADGVNFNPSEHNLVGFSEHFLGAEGAAAGVATGLTGVASGSVEEYLHRAGATLDLIETLLLESGLCGLAQKPCNELSSAEAHMLKLLAVQFSSEKILLLNKPFTLIPEAWRETFANQIVDYAWNKQVVVVVTNLETRPQCWIDNELISRIQIDESKRRSTIGFGSVGPPVRLVSAVRRLGKQSKPSEKEAQVEERHAPVSQEELELRRKKVKRLYYKIVAAPWVLGGCALLVFLFLNRSSGKPSGIASSRGETPEVVANSEEAYISAGSGENAKKDTNKQPPLVPPEVSGKLMAGNKSRAARQLKNLSAEPQYALVLYPQKIQDAVVKAHQGKLRSLPAEFPSRKNSSSASVYRRKERRRARESRLPLPTEFGRTGRTSAKELGPPANERVFSALRDESQVKHARRRERVNFPEPSGDVEKRRQEIRQRFLDAIRNSVNQGDERTDF